MTDRVVNFTSDTNALAGPRPSGELARPRQLTLCELVPDISAILLRIASLDGPRFPSQTLRWWEDDDPPRRWEIAS